MELGNMLFGNSRGEVAIPRGEGYENLLDELMNTIDKEHYEKTMGYGFYFENDIFHVFPYYWGDCTCRPESDTLPSEEEYYNYTHKDTCLLLKPNFLYKPTGYELSWYKYPLRDSYASEDLTLLEFADIIKKCVESLEGE
ncbi:MAG: hypothetical protein ACW99G_07895 [Candidatus Thorarchaeota archaeon]|jgi:hypothetical protein